MSDDANERRDFVAPRRDGRYAGLDLRYLDPADEDDRRFLIEAEHPEFEEVLDRDDEAAELVVDGNLMNPHLHITMHELIANQIWDDAPPETWQAAKRLLADGYDRHEVQHMLASAVSEELWRMTRKQEVFNQSRFVAGLDALPGSWEAVRER